MLRVCACVVLLAGCESSVAPILPAPPPPSPAISIEITGPSRVDVDGTYRWQAWAFGGAGDFRYRWEVTRQGQQSPISDGQKLAMLVTGNDGDLMLLVTVTSGDQTAVGSFRVRNCISVCKS
jgi:hypothetical protein